MKVVQTKDGHMIDVLANEAPAVKKRKPKAKPKYKTNIQLVTDLMTHSQQGVLIQAFVIEAIANYAKQVQASKSNPEWAAQAFISLQ
jgi:uncharacterized protein YgiM (DUF1202 family)